MKKLKIDYKKLEEMLNKNYDYNPDSYNSGWIDGYKMAIKDIIGAEFNREKNRYEIVRYN